MFSRCGEVCSHVAALLFKVEACICLKIATLTCTDLLCVWNLSFSKKVSHVVFIWNMCVYVCTYISL